MRMAMSRAIMWLICMRVRENLGNTKYVAHIMNELYNDSSSGYAGNDDCGEMSAWYVFGALGFYPVNPVSGKYIIGTPMLEEAVIQLPDGKTFTIKAPRKEHNEIYIRSMKLNGKKYTKNYITHQDIMNGGTLEFVMTASPGNDNNGEVLEFVPGKISKC